MPELTRWLAGADTPSIGTFLKVIDILIEEGRNPGSATANEPPRDED